MIPKEILSEAREYYMTEACAYYAIAQHRRTGLPLGALVDEGNRWSRSLPSIAHVFVFDPRTRLALDIEGVKTLEDMRRRWFDLEQPSLEIFPSEAALRRKYMGAHKPLFAFSAREIKQAMVVAEAVATPHVPLR